MPILPITIRNSANILPADTFDLIPGDIELIVHPPIVLNDKNPAVIARSLKKAQDLIADSL